MKKSLKKLLKKLGLLDLANSTAEKYYTQTEIKRHKKFVVSQYNRRKKFFEVPHNSAKSSETDLISTLQLLRVTDLNIPLMRIGGAGDGGYVIPSDLSSIKTCFSPGVAENADFESSLAELGIFSFLADASVDRPPVESDFFDFEKKFIGNSTGPDWISLEDWISTKAPNGKDMLLQMDIEGGEWQVLNSADSKTLNKFAIIAIELHDMHMIFSEIGRTTVESVLKKLNENFYLIFLTPNNGELPFTIEGIELPPLLEATYIRKDFAEKLISKTNTNPTTPADWSVGKNVSWLAPRALDPFFRQKP